MDILRSKLSDLLNITYEIKSSKSLQSSHIKWTYLFEHLLPPSPAEIIEEARINLPAITFIPAIQAVITEKKSKRHIGTYSSDFSVSKNCDIRFKITNSETMPVGSKLVWMVRNQGKEASEISDLGHKEILNPYETTSRGTSYNGPHYMECYVTMNGTVMGHDRIGVKVRTTMMPPRNPKKPAYTRIRK